jgi:hypothetical protein
MEIERQSSISLKYFILISFTARFAKDAGIAEFEILSFTVERTVKRNQSKYILLQLFIVITNYFFRRDEFPITFRPPAESNKKDSLRS